MPYLLLFLILIPIIEIYLFIELGGAIGVGSTLLVIIATAILGGYLLKREGLSLLQEFAKKSAMGGNVSEVLLEGLLVVFAGALLLTPGFMTDFVGFLMILPYSRKFIGRGLLTWFLGKFGGNFHYSHHKRRDDGIIDVEYEEIESDKGDKNE